MDRIYMAIATGGGSGYLPKAPGTWGSLVGVLLWFFLHGLSPAHYGLLVVGLFILGAIAAGAAEKIVDHADPGLVVIDEIVGQMIALAASPINPLTIILGFVFFRFFDILKPFPVGWLDSHIHGGLGIMLDDVAAGLYGLLLLQTGLWLFY